MTDARVNPKQLASLFIDFPLSFADDVLKKWIYQLIKTRSNFNDHFYSFIVERISNDQLIEWRFKSDMNLLQQIVCYCDDMNLNQFKIWMRAFSFRLSGDALNSVWIHTVSFSGDASHLNAWQMSLKSFRETYLAIIYESIPFNLKKMTSNYLCPSNALNCLSRNWNAPPLKLIEWFQREIIKKHGFEDKWEGLILNRDHQGRYPICGFLKSDKFEIDSFESLLNALTPNSYEFNAIEYWFDACQGIAGNWDLKTNSKKLAMRMIYDRNASIETDLKWHLDQNGWPLVSHFRSWNGKMDGDLLKLLIDVDGLKKNENGFANRFWNSFATGSHDEIAWDFLQNGDIVSALKKEFGDGFVNNLLRLVGQNACGNNFPDEWASSPFDEELALQMNSMNNFHKFEMDVNGICKYWQREISTQVNGDPLKLICEYSKIFEWK